jgi:serine/threonine protein kinase
LREILSFTPDSELPPSAYEGALVSPDDLPPDDDLQIHNEEHIRRQLTAAVACIVEEHPDSERLQTEAITRLIAAYPRAVHKAWLVVPGHKTLGRIFGREVVREISRGAFGLVYEVRDPQSGEIQACKILLSEVKGDVAFLLGFRRGVASMRILHERAVSGMVMLKEAFEVPPTIFMEFVNGMTLDVAFQDGYLLSPQSRLRVVHRVAEIVAAGHALEEVVLHRDIKPANVMLRNPVFGQDDFDVVVLDFDLSWHRGFHDLSVAHNARVLGYAAPEQVVKHDLAPTEKTRNAAVDSFGLGMLVFFVVVGRHPFPGEQQSMGFFSTVLEAARRICPARWRSIPYALADLIVRCTDLEQSVRPTMSQIVSRLTLIRHTLADDRIPFDCDLALKEIAARAWGDDVLKSLGTVEDIEAISTKRPGIEAEIRVETSGIEQVTLRVKFTRGRQEHDDRSTFEKYIKGKAERSATALRKGNFSQIGHVVTGGQAVVVGTYTVSDLGERTISDMAKTLGTVMHTLTAV